MTSHLPRCCARNFGHFDSDGAARLDCTSPHRVGDIMTSMEVDQREAGEIDVELLGALVVSDIGHLRRRTAFFEHD